MRISNHVESMKLLNVDYSLFRRTLGARAGSKIKSKGMSTVLYDRFNNVLAVVKAASIDETGRCSPAQYFVSLQQVASVPSGDYPQTISLSA